MKWYALAAIVSSVSTSVVACGPVDEGLDNGNESFGIDEQAVSGSVLQQRCDMIKAAAAARGITNPLVIAGVGYHESGSLNQCWSEATWGCQGPYSADCGGPVLAGSGDGACSSQQGGIGMFQFDDGNYQETLSTYGTGILTVSGNINAAVNLIIFKVWNSNTTPFFPDEASEIAWINSAVPGTQAYEDWLTTMATYYNGCGVGCANHQWVRSVYDSATRNLLSMYGDTYWYGSSSPPPPSGSSCSCSGGTDHRGISIPASSTYCGFRVCGADYKNYECTQTGWAYVSGSSCGYGQCKCYNGSDDQGRSIDPNATECGYRVCGGDHQFYDCKSSGWLGTGIACSSTN